MGCSVCQRRLQKEQETQSGIAAAVIKRLQPGNLIKSLLVPLLQLISLGVRDRTNFDGES
jgi:hypothetical protein